MLSQRPSRSRAVPASRRTRRRTSRGTRPAGRVDQHQDDDGEHDHRAMPRRSTPSGGPAPPEGVALGSGSATVSSRRVEPSPVSLPIRPDRRKVVDYFSTGRRPRSATASRARPGCRRPAARRPPLTRTSVSDEPLSSSKPNCSGLALGDRQLAHDDAVVQLRGGHVERRRQVHDQAVDLSVLQRLHRGVVGLEDGRLWVGLIRR